MLPLDSLLSQMVSLAILVWLFTTFSTGNLKLLLSDAWMWSMLTFWIGCPPWCH